MEVTELSRWVDAEWIKDRNSFVPKHELHTVEEFLQILDEAPTADVVEVVHGRWKPWDLTFGRSVYACSVCGEGENVPTVMGKPMFSYCPNCGAKMDGGANDESD